MPMRPGSLLALSLATSALAACAGQPAGETVTKFAAGLDSMQDSMNATLALISQNEVDANTYSAYAAQVAASGRGIASAPGRPRTSADLARAALNPAFGALARYAARLTDLGGVPAPSTANSIAARYPNEAASAARALGQRTGHPLPDSVIANGTAAIQALAQVAEGGGAADIPTVVRAMQPQVANLDAFVTAVIGADDSAGLRLAAAEADRRNVADVDRDIAAINADRQETRADRMDRVLARLHARDAEPTLGLLDALVMASHEVVEAHAALANPDTPDAEAAVTRFQNSVDEVQQRYERLHRG